MYSYWLKGSMDAAKWTDFVLVLLKLWFFTAGHRANIATAGKLRFVASAL
jgi:hypothetical protein